MKKGLVGLVAGLLLATAGPARAQDVREVSRSAPIVETDGADGTQYQGTYEVVTPTPEPPEFLDASSAATFEFPHIKGHLRAVDTDNISAIDAEFDALPAIFDAAEHIPPVVPGCSTRFGATCRTVFTTIEGPDTAGLAQRPDRIFFDTANRDQLKPFLAFDLPDAAVDVLINRVLAGVPDTADPPNYSSGLGGIDRSTLAVIGTSPFIPQISGEDRPKMIYVGALDGMLHAFCAEVRGPCAAAGQELWAFIPRTQLGELRHNSQRIDGSVKVADVFDAFDVANPGVRQFRTVLTLQTGSGDPDLANREPSILAIDVSNPADPIVLWERSTPSSRGSIDQGVGLGLAMGPVRIAGQIKNLVFAQTNNGGTSSASGFYLFALDTSTGDFAWDFEHAYPAPRNGANPSVPDSGIPGGAAALDIDRTGLVTHVAAASLYGDLWVFDSSGSSLYRNISTGADKPLFRFSTDFHPIGAPPTIYADLATARFYAVVVSGGYADRDAATWVKDSDDQFAVSVAIESSNSNAPMNENPSIDYGEDRAFSVNLGSGRRITAQAIVAGNELFVVADKTDVNLLSYGEAPDTGSLHRISLETGTTKGSLLTIAGGGSSAAVVGAGVVHVGSGSGAMKVDVQTAGGGGVFDGAGAPVERGAKTNNARLLWMNG